MRSLYQVQSHIKKAKTVSWESIGKEPYYHPSRNLEEQFWIGVWEKKNDEMMRDQNKKYTTNQQEMRD